MEKDIESNKTIRKNSNVKVFSINSSLVEHRERTYSDKNNKSFINNNINNLTDSSLTNECYDNNYNSVCLTEPYDAAAKKDIFNGNLLKRKSTKSMNVSHIPLNTLENQDLEYNELNSIYIPKENTVKNQVEFLSNEIKTFKDLKYKKANTNSNNNNIKITNSFIINKKQDFNIQSSKNIIDISIKKSMVTNSNYFSNDNYNSSNTNINKATDSNVSKSSKSINSYSVNSIKDNIITNKNKLFDLFDSNNIKISCKNCNLTLLVVDSK